MPNAKTQTLRLAPVDPDNEVEIAELTRQRVVSRASEAGGRGEVTGVHGVLGSQC